MLKPGKIFKLENSTELRAFEAIVAAHVDPNMLSADLADWECRKPLIDIIRPDNFYGTLSDVQIEVMNRPCDLLATIEDRGLKQVRDFSMKLAARENYASGPEHCFGFRLSADAKSSSAGIIHRIERELWYLPLSRRSFIKGANGRIRRVIAKPESEQKMFDEAHSRSARNLGAKAVKSLRSTSSGRASRRPTD